jgi:hypothetical protein
MSFKAIEQWLTPLDGAALECDGFSQVASMLLHRESIPHQIVLGSLTVDGVGQIPVHFWITFNDGSICDFRARMWLGSTEAVPHGVFLPNACQTYTADSMVKTRPLDESLFHILAGCEQSSFAPISYF